MLERLAQYKLLYFCISVWFCLHWYRQCPIQIYSNMMLWIVCFGLYRRDISDVYHFFSMLIPYLLCHLHCVWREKKRSIFFENHFRWAGFAKTVLEDNFINKTNQSHLKSLPSKCILLLYFVCSVVFLFLYIFVYFACLLFCVDLVAFRARRKLWNMQIYSLRTT